MIFYFSGTGNSLWAAEKISIAQGQKLFSIADEIKKNNFEYTLDDSELVGFVFPIYAWNAPKMVVDFINKLKLKNYKANYTFAISTCEANVGYTMRNLKDTLNSKGLELDSGFSIAMPSNYIILTHVKSKTSIEAILDTAEERIEEINTSIDKRENKFEITLGQFPYIKSKLINPLFMKYGIKPKKFFASNSCISCGLCEKVCPTNNIKVDVKPKWGTNCTQCLACINRCPKKAIEYGKSTRDKGRYYNPRCKK
ncbi:EFR1 family ferrodoxin [Clostridium sp. HBUAS56017]|uniref:EFR1 family ferrodoxin n=1 Tax=Clostridium sp. HBUAS56017 TaxID=2571128 RepID=UPI00117802B0|nr:EFR1 family ferrodoxin [Clostridium sp. HBUAS56017]